MQTLHFIGVNIDVLILLLILVVNGILALRVIKKAGLRDAITNAVAAAAQYEKNLIANGQRTTAATLKQFAIDFVQARFPGVNVSLLEGEIEAAVAFWNLEKAKGKPAPVADPSTTAEPEPEPEPAPPTPPATIEVNGVTYQAVVADSTQA
jgi:hypothetical protein